MASKAELAARPVMPPLPDGSYGVPDPNDPDVMTLWHVQDGKRRAWPPGRRWAPRPPSRDPVALPGEHREARERWYLDVYWSWVRAVHEEILRDLPAARSQFEHWVQHDETPDAHQAAREAERARGHEERRRREQEARELWEGETRTIALLAAAGISYRRIGRTLGIPKSTVWELAQRGAALWAQDPPGAWADALENLPPLDALEAAIEPPTVRQEAF